MIYYLASPIDYCENQGGWKEDLKSLCKIHDEILLFDPYAPYTFTKSNKEMAKYIHDMNMLAIMHGNAVVARMMTGQTSIGTPIELYYALKINKPVILITDMEKSVYMQYIGLHATVVKDVNQAYGKMLELEKTMKEGIVYK